MEPSIASSAFVRLKRRHKRWHEFEIIFSWFGSSEGLWVERVASAANVNEADIRC